VRLRSTGLEGRVETWTERGRVARRLATGAALPCKVTGAKRSVARRASSARPEFASGPCHVPTPLLACTLSSFFSRFRIIINKLAYTNVQLTFKYDFRTAMLCDHMTFDPGI
jgi:hypothetical protein